MYEESTQVEVSLSTPQRMCSIFVLSDECRRIQGVVVPAPTTSTTRSSSSNNKGITASDQGRHQSGFRPISKTGLPRSKTAQAALTTEPSTVTTAHHMANNLRETKNGAASRSRRREAQSCPPPSSRGKSLPLHRPLFSGGSSSTSSSSGGRSSAPSNPNDSFVDEDDKSHPESHRTQREWSCPPSLMRSVFPYEQDMEEGMPIQVRHQRNQSANIINSKTHDNYRASKNKPDLVSKTSSRIIRAIVRGRRCFGDGSRKRNQIIPEVST